ncbi:MBL fold metallo-hydrolase [Paractinoplanes atraurantiacus]|uniref:Glyoxylase, beta-lactamase superfamily II n=1 Tax=Paractinoplanes atraurantiacus TaxID=1036182 RepID=A0A285KNC9_9ACTN|nr:MBL fold metallo-hydrolase [Actinoplanes atraurantiacus]SNY74144.1 Glyoxylase, beta-lactamase superfamily II [Actinoplanes atraurantiacus]
MQYAVHSARRPGVTRDLPYGPEDLLWVANSATLIYGERDAVLIDTYTTIEQNETLIEWVRSFDRRLTHLYITHGHGDHFFGAGQIAKAFPGVRAVATEATVRLTAFQGGPQYLNDFWERLFPGQIPKPLQLPEPLAGSTLDLEGSPLEIVGTGYSDTENTTALWSPDLRLLVAGDVAYNDIHPYLAETTAETREQRAATADRLRGLDPAAVVAGHKKPDLPDDPAILAQTADYLRTFNTLAEQTTTAEQLYGAMLKRYPTRANPGSLWGGAKRAKPRT